jgi:uncharacterized iron-regulated membrane protein
MTRIDDPSSPRDNPSRPSAEGGSLTTLPDPRELPAVPPDATTKDRRRGWGLDVLRPLLLRLHFYAGVLIAPFLLISALTGLAFTLAPTLDHLVYRHELVVPASGERQPLSAQVAAARAAHPEGSLTAVIPAARAEGTTQVVLAVPELGAKQRTVFVDPYTGQVRGALTTSFSDRPLTGWLEEFHRSLQLGSIGRLYSEVSASWLWIVTGGGLILWLRRRRTTRRTRRILAPQLSAVGRKRTLSWHGALGVWLAVGLFGLSATGLTWSHYAGAHFDSVLTSLNAHAPSVNTALPASQPTAAVNAADIDSVLATARTAGISGGVEIALPAAADRAWTVTQNGRTWPLHADSVAVDASTRSVTASSDYATWSTLAKLSKLGINAHMGYLFGWANQLTLALLALGIIAMIVLGYRSWWQRRRGSGRFRFGSPAPRGTWRCAHPPALITLALVTGALAWALPVFGATLAGFLIIDLGLGIRPRRRSAWLSPEVPVTADA